MSTTNDYTIFVLEEPQEIYFTGSIHDTSMSNLSEKILQLEQKIIKAQNTLEDIIKKDNIFKLEFTPRPIKLYINSYGGSAHSVFGAIDTIKNTKIPVHTICKGIVASAATLLSIVGKKRYITENSFMLIHELRSSTWGKFTEIKDQFENSKLLMDHIKNFYVKHTKLTLYELDDILRNDLYWNAEMCLEKGLVDEIM